jgi:Holliday junction resolvase
VKNEKGVKDKVKKLLVKHGWFYFMPPANAYGRSGISDFIALKAGVMLAIETKFGSNKPTAMQKAFLESINAESAFGFVVNEGNLDWLAAFLEDFGAQTELVASEGKMANEAGARLVDAIRALQALI